MFESIDREGEPLSALVNNAGILFEQSTVESLTAERINRVLATNVTGYFFVLSGSGKAHVFQTRRARRGDCECVFGGIAAWCAIRIC